MDRGRLEAFSDGVLAIIITIMVLELRVPVGSGWSALRPVVPVFLTYAVSFLYVGIYWNNHHHLLKACHRVTAPIMWANLLLLFSLSLFPFSTGWVGENHLSAVPTFLYGAVLLSAALAYYTLQRAIVAGEGGASSQLAAALGRDWKGRLSPVIYASAMGLAFVTTWASAALYVGAALIWLIPDRRIEHLVAGQPRTPPESRAFSMTRAAGDSTRRSVLSEVSPKAFLVALDSPSTPTTRPLALSGIDRNVAIPPSSSAPSMPSGSAIRGTRSATSTCCAGHLTGRAGDRREELRVLLVRGVLGERHVRGAVVEHEDRGEVVVDDAAEHGEHGGDRLLEAEHLRRDGGHLGVHLGLEELAVQQVADPGVHVVVAELDRVGTSRLRPPRDSSARWITSRTAATSCGASKSLDRKRSAPTRAPQ
jgi:uncharacterized membrane protein